MRIYHLLAITRYCGSGHTAAIIWPYQECLNGLQYIQSVPDQKCVSVHGYAMESPWVVILLDACSGPLFIFCISFPAGCHLPSPPACLALILIHVFWSVCIWQSPFGYTEDPFGVHIPHVNGHCIVICILQLAISSIICYWLIQISGFCL